MTQSTIFAAVSDGPILKVSFALLLLLTALIVYWIISNTKKTAAINKNLEVIANHDSLTGLLNRRFLETSLIDLWQYPVKIPSQAAVFMVDIDNFKNYNDLFGHQVGDDCLRHIASLFKNTLEGFNGHVMRYGGEEFMAAVFSIDRQTALKLGQAICHQVAKAALPNGSGGVVTVSVGACYIPSTLDRSLSDCIQIADKALYEAKKSGKNKVIFLDASETEKQS